MVVILNDCGSSGIVAVAFCTLFLDICIAITGNLPELAL